jgi:flagellar hook-associated protein 1 FlgK
MLDLIMGIETAMKSLIANSTAINTTIHNVANMASPDYSKQLSNITASTPLSIAGQAGQMGTGSQVSSIERIRDIYLDAQIQQALMNYGDAEIMNRTYQNLAAFFPEVNGVTTNGLGSQIAAFFTAWNDVATQAQLAATVPPTANTLNTALNTVYQLAISISKLLNTTSNDLANMQVDLNSDLKTTIQSANVYIKEIYNLNKSIVFAEGQGQRPNDLLDQRTAAMAKLAELVNFDTANRTDGSVIIMLGGRALVDGASGYNTLTTMTSGTVISTAPLSFDIRDARLEAVGISSSNGGNPVKLDEAIFTGGKIAGILNSRDNIVHDYKSQLDSVANTLITMVNSLYDATKTNGNTNNKDFFSGVLASDIAVNNSIKSGNDISYTMYNPGDIAQILGDLNNKLVSSRVVSDPLALISNTVLPLPPGTNGTLVINQVSIPVTSGMTVEDLVNAINTHSSVFSAVYNDTTKTFFMVSDEPLTIQEVNLGGNFLKNMKLINEQISTAPVAYTNSMSLQTVNQSITWALQKNVFDYEPSLNGGSINIYMGGNKYPLTWSDTQVVSTTRWSIFSVDLINPTPPGISLNDFLNGKFIFGTRVGDSVGAADTISPFIISDVTGNLTQTMKFVGNMTFGQYYNSITGNLEGSISSSTNMLTSSKSAVDQLQTMQANITHVDAVQEQAQARLYQRAYDASVQLMTVIDEMMNILINHTGTPSSNPVA